MNVLTPQNLIMIGFQQSEHNPNVYIRNDGQFEFDGSISLIMQTLLSRKGESEADVKARSDSYLKWQDSIIEEIHKKLGI